MEEQGESIAYREESKDYGFGNRLLRFLLRFLVVLVFGIGIGIAAYYGVPALYRDFIEPIRSNSERIAALEESIARVQVDFRERDSDITSNLIQIEGVVAQQREDISGLAAMGEGQVSQIEDVVKSLETNQRWLTRLEGLEEKHLALEVRFDSMEELLAKDDVSYDRLEVRIQLLRVMELVTRARFWMVQGNLGEASDDLNAARNVLESLNVDDMNEETYLPLIGRLDQILLEISLNPIIAADDLEIVWQLLLLATEP